MKVAFSRTVNFIPKWKRNDELPLDEQIKTILTPMEMGDLIILMDSFQGLDNKDTLSSEPKNVNTVKQFKLIVDSIGHLIPKYATIENLEDESGIVGSEELCKYPYFMGLAAEILTKMGSISMPDEGDEKNLKKLPGYVAPLAAN